MIPLSDWSKEQQKKRAVVVAALHYNGEFYKKLSPEIWQEAYLKCDGYGIIGKEFAIEQCWDWSHVRDSSPAGIEAAYGVLMKHLHVLIDSGDK